MDENETKESSSLKSEREIKGVDGQTARGGWMSNGRTRRYIYQKLMRQWVTITERGSRVLAWTSWSLVMETCEAIP